MSQEPHEGFSHSRALLPEGCSDLLQAIQLREEEELLIDQIAHRYAGLLLERVVVALDRDLLLSFNPDFIKPEINRQLLAYWDKEPLSKRLHSDFSPEIIQATLDQLFSLTEAIFKNSTAK